MKKIYKLNENFDYIGEQDAKSNGFCSDGFTELFPETASIYGSMLGQVVTTVIVNTKRQRKKGEVKVIIEPIDFTYQVVKLKGVRRQVLNTALIPIRRDFKLSRSKRHTLYIQVS